MNRTLKTWCLLLVPLAAGCGGPGKKVEILENQNRDLQRQVEQLRTTVASLEKLPFEVEAAKAYGSQLTEKIKAMRADTVQRLEEQRVLTDGVREEHLRILHREQELFKTLQSEVQVAIDEIQKKTRSPKEVNGRPQAAGFSSPDQPSPSPDPQEKEKEKEKEKEAEPPAEK